MTGRAAIVLVTTSFPRAGDGSEAAGSFVSDLADELSQGIPVRVVAPGSTRVREKSPSGVDVFRYPAPAQAMSTLRPWHPAELSKIRMIYREGMSSTRQAVSADQTALVLALWALPSGAWARRAAREAAVPYAVWTLGSDVWSLGRIPGVRQWLRSILSGAERCFSDGLKLADDTRRIARREVEFLPSTRKIGGSRTAPLKSKGPYRILFMGRWHANKGVDLFLQALKQLNEQEWKSVESVTICGGGPLQPVVENYVAQLKLDGRPIELQGYLAKPAAERALIAADYLVIPSRIESIPVVLSDACKLGCAVLVCPVGDLPGIVAGTPPAGLVARQASVEAVAHMLSEALRHAPSEFAAGIEAVAARFDLTQIAMTLRATARAKGQVTDVLAGPGSGR